jgi:hypothetical protein
VSLLGERRIGKSSVLNQVYQGLGQEPKLVSIHASAQNWNLASQQNFFQHLYQTIRTTVPDVPSMGVEGYPGLRNAIAALSRRYRFLLIIDGFEEMAGNPNFDRFFFSNLRALGDGPEYSFGYLLASRRPLKELCSQHKIQASKFWNIFGSRRVLGLLEEREARDLVQQESNAAFENHWEDTDTATHRVLSALAWATGETDRQQLDSNGIAAAQRETRLEFSRDRLFKILERLAEEEILERKGPPYRFAVPLYRRWIAWRWLPERVREEPLSAEPSERYGKARP